METRQLLDHISLIISQDGPKTEDYKSFTLKMNELANQINQNKLTLNEIQSLKNKCNFLKDEKSIMGHILHKPYGYAGDFHIIDRIYTKDISDKFSDWDKFAISNSAAQAVRNRKEYFKEKMAQISPKGTLLNVASGPARDLFELYKENPGLDITATCIEMDSNAIEYAKKLNAKYLDKTTFLKKNIFRFKTENKFDMIWSAGLFDYFDDKAFILLIKRFKEWIKDGGEIIIGNFNKKHNPSRAYMEIFGEWYLNHRSEEQLHQLAKQAGYSPSKINIGKESENVNLFLHLKK